MLDLPGTSKIKLPCRRELNFQHFIVFILSFVWDSVLASKILQNRTQDGPKSCQIRGQNFNELGSGFWSQLGSNLGPNLGVKKGTPVDLGDFYGDENRRPIFITPSWAPRPSGTSKRSIFAGFLLYFLLAFF